jgi:hypothetical protein
MDPHAQKVNLVGTQKGPVNNTQPAMPKVALIEREEQEKKKRKKKKQQNFWFSFHRHPNVVFALLDRLANGKARNVQGEMVQF